MLYSDRATRALLSAQDCAVKLGSRHIEPEHLMLGLLAEEDSPVSETIRDIGIDVEQLRSVLNAELDERTGPNPDPGLSPSCKKVLLLALEEAKVMRDSQITTKHLLLGLLKEQYGKPSSKLEKYGLRYKDVRQKVEQAHRTDW